MTTSIINNAPSHKSMPLACSKSSSNTTQTLSDVNKNIGQRIKLYRRMLNLSQKELAQSLTKPISAQQLQKYENGTNNISIKILSDIARVLGISMDKLVISVETSNSEYTLDYISKLNRNKSSGDNSLTHLSDIADALNKAESMALKDKIVELVKMLVI